MERDTQRQELNKVKLTQGEVAYQMEGAREEIHKLTQQINQAELQLNKVCTVTVTCFPLYMVYINVLHLVKEMLNVHTFCFNPLY